MKAKLLIPIVVVLVIFAAAVFTNIRSKQDKVESEAVVLNVMIMSSASKETVARISDALSDVTMEKCGFRVHLTNSSVTEYTAALHRLAALGKEPDVFIAYQNPALRDLAKTGLALPLDELLNEYPLLKDSVPNEYWHIGIVDGQIYGIPTIISRNYAMGFIARKDILDSLSIEADNIQTWEGLHELLILVKETYPDVTPVVPHFGTLFPTFEEDPLGDGLGVLVNHEGTTVENLYESEVFYELCQKMQGWYQEGLLLENGYAYVTEPRNVLITAFNALGYFAKVNEFASANGVIIEGTEMVNIQLSQPYIDSAMINVSWSVSSKTTKQKEALQLIELLYTDREAVDICLYGQEGIDYQRVDETHITALNGKGSWNSTTWGWPNRIAGSIWLNPTTLEPDAYEIKGEPIISPAFGFVFFAADLQKQMDACQKVVDKYANSLMYGYLDPDEALPLFNQELKEAGIDQIIAEKQRQLDLFLEIKHSGNGERK